MSDVLSIWTIYDKPDEYPLQYVARRSEAHADGAVHTPDVMIADDLTALRMMIRQQFPGLVRIMRSPQDPPQIVETWL